MKRRLRKKKRLGEFQELGFEVTYRFAPQLPEAEREELMWRFITEAIEPNDLVAGGGGGGEEHGFFVTSAKQRGSATDQQRLAVRQWLTTCPDITDSEVGPLRDAWYGWDD